MQKKALNPWLKYLRPVLVALLICLPGLALAQVLQEMKFELLDEKDGLSSHMLTSVAQDSSGFIWLGTKDGLNRYDGYSFKIFRHIKGDSTSLRTDNGQNVYVAPDGTIWVSYPQGAFGRYDRGSNSFHHCPELYHGDKWVTENAKILYLDIEGYIWFSGRGSGLNAYHTGTGHLKHYDLPYINPRYPENYQNSYKSVSALYAAPNGLFWLVSLNGLYCFNPRTEEMDYKRYGVTEPESARYDGFNSILPDGDQGLWLSAWGGGISYYSFSDGKFVTYQYVEVKPFEAFGNNVDEVKRKSADELWVATEDEGLLVFNTRTKQFEHLAKGQIPESTENASGVFWVLTLSSGEIFISANSGLSKYSPYQSLFRFKTLSIASSQNSDGFRINKVIEDEANHAIYFGLVLGNGFDVLDTKTNKLQAFHVDVPPVELGKIMTIADMLIDQSGLMWVLSNDYLYEFDRVKRRLLKQENYWPEKEKAEQHHFRNIIESVQGDIWVTTQEGGLYLFDPLRRKFSARLNFETGQHPPSVVRVAFDHVGRMWLQSGGEIWTYEKAAGRFTSMLPKQFLKWMEKSICGLAADTSGNIWVAVAEKGLLLISMRNPQQPTFEWAISDNQFATLRFNSMKSDPFGNLWISTISGVVYYQTSTRTIRNFNYMAGMNKNNMFMRFINGYRDEFYITTPGKYCKVEFDRLAWQKPRPRVYLERFNVLNKERIGSLEGVELVQLAPNENFFSFDFGCIDFSNQSLHQFAYMLEGWDKDWVNCGTRRFANYTNLNGGDYVFKVKVANSEGEWSEPASISIFIRTPFYKQTWFLLLATFLFAALLYGLYLYRVNQVEQTGRLKTEFNRQLAETRMQALRAQMNPHFIFNSLNSINRYIIKNDIKTSSLYLTRFAKLIRLILDNSANKNVAMSREIEALTLYIDIEALRFDHKFTFEVNVAPDVDVANIEVPPLIIQPYVENAIWHGLLHKEAGGHLLVKITQDNDCLICEVTDNGIGRVKAREFKSSNAPTRQSIGMKLTEERLQLQSSAEIHTDSVQIIDLYDPAGDACGTTVIIKIFL